MLNRGRARIVRIPFIFLLFLSLIIAIPSTVLAAQEETPTAGNDIDLSEKKVLRVGLSESKGLSFLDEYGNPTGLIVDYLNEISKYTDWQYEYHFGDPEEIFEESLNGKYDLMGGVYYAPSLEEYYGFPKYSIGSNQAVLYGRKDDNRLKSYDLTSLNGMTIGVYEQAKEKIRRLEEFLNFNDLKCELKSYSHDDMVAETLYTYLENKDIDLLLGNDMENASQFRAVTSFDAQPYYITTRPGEQEILDGLNMAIEKILDSTPHFNDELYTKYFTNNNETDVQFTDEELAYISANGNVKISVVNNWHPFYCLDNDKDHHDGLVPDLIELISEISNLNFTYVYADTYAESISQVQNGEADLLGWYLDSAAYSETQNLALTRSYLSLNNMIIRNKSVSYPGDNLTGGIMEGRSLPDEISAAKIRYYPTSFAGIEAVSRGEIDFFYGLSSSLEQEIQSHQFLNISPITLSNKSTVVSFAMARPITPELMTILNKSISAVSNENLDSLIDRNMVSVGRTEMSLKDMIYANPFAFLAIFSLILLLIVAVFLIVVRSRVKNTLMQNELKKAEAESKAKGDFLSRMSHEIRTPMNAIVGLTDLTCMMDEVPRNVEANLKKLRSSSQYLLSLINDILDMSRIDNGMLTIAAEPFSLKHMLGEIVEMMNVQAEQKQLIFEYRCSIEHDWLIGDPIRLRQVLINLLSNAIKFTSADGTVAFDIAETSGDERSGSFRFSVQDTGIGIPYDSQEQIFGAFEQLGANVSKSAGTGLGLPISRNIVRLMGGDLKLRSEPDKGSEFYFSLTLPYEDSPPASSVSDDASMALNGLRVLLAEDNDLNAEIATDLLKMQGINTERASDGLEAVQMFIESPQGYYNLILMDIQMPNKNGLDAAVEIRACPHPDASAIPIIAMTANSFQEDVEAAIGAGMNDFIPKPVDSEYLFEVIRTHHLLLHTETSGISKKRNDCTPG
ncbi:ATP-binding protein [Diplocloster hominis]|uniref:ATP-binding protein n=1 Tax=Diplocloster hominis TaxID=3079010 RepID=UPI0031BAD652